jgi:hypothetical protein
VHEVTVITVNVATEKQHGDYWILDTCPTNHVTRNRYHFEPINPMGKREYHVKTANNHLVDAKGSGMISFNIDRLSAKPAKIKLQHVLNVPACGTKTVSLSSS